VGHAHERGLIHRDLKPGNVLLEERCGRVVARVADFGLVKDAAEPGQTQAGAMMGSLNYAAPEQILDASSVDHRADLFSLGILLTELLTGRFLFQASSLGALLEAYRAGPDLTGLDADWASICKGLLALQPDRRTANCAELLQQIAQTHGAVGADVLASHRPLATAARALARLPASSAMGASLNGARSGQAPIETSSDHPHTLVEPESEDDDSFIGLLATPEPLIPPNNLPAEMDGFIGRQSALQLLSQHLDMSRLVTLLGTGGMGKTRLALQFARQHLSEYPGGVFFCDLSDARTLDDIVFTVGQSMGVPLKRGDPLKQLGHAIAWRGPCLLILDNFEQLTAFSAQTVERWLEKADKARFVVTSRVLLEISGERTMRLAPLDEDDAVALFVERAVSKVPGFAMSEADREAVVRLVHQLDGMPLAIELATARVKVMKPQQILSRMHQRFPLLATGRRNSAHRQATLRATIDWSWELLEEWEKVAFAQCAVFEGGFTLEAAEAIIDLDGFADAPWPMDAVQSLVDKSLLVPLGETPIGEVRFGMLTSIHDYAREKLAATPTKQDDAQRRHLGFYARFGERDMHLSMFRSGGDARWKAMTFASKNLLIANERANQRGAPVEAAKTALAVVDVLERTQPSVARAVLERSLSPETLPFWRAGLQRGMGFMDQILGNLEDGILILEQALLLVRQISDRYGEAAVLRHLGVLYSDQGRFQDALPVLEESLAGFRAIGHRPGEGNTLVNIGIVRIRCGDMVSARACLTEAAEILRANGSRRGEALAIGNLARIHAGLGQYDEAAAQFQAAVSIYREVGDRSNEASSLGNLGLVRLIHGRRDDAEQIFRAALTIYRENGVQRGVGIMLSNMARLNAERGQARSAIQREREALEIYREIGSRYSESISLAALGEYGLMLDQRAASRQAFEAAIALARAIGNRRIEAGALGFLGLLHAQEGAVDTGRASMRTGEEMLRERRDPHRLAILLCLRARLEHQAGRPADAQTALDEARAIARELKMVPSSHLVEQIEEIQSALLSGAR
ncbi:MAG: tetratricopeptide repeat protein, partial [Myxococcota bacterium]